MNRRVWTLVASACTLAALIAVAVWLPVPYVRMSPGPTYNVIGDVGGREVIEITGTTTYPTSGALDMTTVRESGGPRGGLTFVQAIGAWFSESDAVVPQELLYREPVTADEIRERNARLFQRSEMFAVAAALNYLGLPTRLTPYIAAIRPGAPADGVLQLGDVVISVNETVIDEPNQVADAIVNSPVGTSFDLGIIRNGQASTVTVQTAANPENSGKSFIGVDVGAFFRGDFDITLNLEDIGGPSAGMMFALGIVDKLTPEDLTAGNTIAGTGTIQPDGTVGAVGGVRQKLVGAKGAGAELFLMSPRQCPEAEGRVPAGLTVVPVETLAEAVTAIGLWQRGQQVPGCPVRGADGA